MTTPLSDYALLADRLTCALVSRTGSIDWLCLPRFDSGAVFTRLLGKAENGHWSIEIADGEVMSREYVDGSFVLRTRWRTESGEAVVTEFMPQSEQWSHVIRRVEVVSGEVEVKHELRIRFDYGSREPWIRHVEEPGGAVFVAICGAHAVTLRGPRLQAKGRTHVGSFTLGEGEAATWTMSYFPSWEQIPAPTDPVEDLERTLGDWEKWFGEVDGELKDPAVRRSLSVLRALTHQQTGGVVAAPTTSLPEEFGGSRNWDYRYVWLRDSALSIQALLAHGLKDPLWRNWLLRAIAGDHTNPRIMYGIGGERVDQEQELEHLAGYANSRPVRINNGAAGQYQADIVGEVMIALKRLRDAGIADDRFSWGLQQALLASCERRIDEPDSGIWEMRGEPQFYTHGRTMLWAAFDCGIDAVERHGLKGDVERWRELRDRLRSEIEQRGWNEQVQSFTQTYANTSVDASLLVLPHTGFVAWDDPRMIATVNRIERELVDEHGLVHRYLTDGSDGVQGGEYPFLLCCFWLVESYARTGRLDDARRLYDQVVSYGGELGLLSEEYDPKSGLLAGNFPQAFSHLGLIEAEEAIREASGAME